MGVFCDRKERLQYVNKQLRGLRVDGSYDTANITELSHLHRSCLDTFDPP